MGEYDALFRKIVEEVIKELGLKVDKSGKRELVKIIKKGLEERGYTL